MNATTVYDVAISFVAADEPLAVSLRAALQPPLSVFVYSKAQEQLAGRDGIEAFRTVFRETTRLVVILYRQPWGETPWTRVESLAIEEHAHERGWDHLMFVRLVPNEPVPKWVPKPHLYLDFERYTLSDLVGAIKTRMVELGVEPKPVSPVDRASALKEKRKFDDETQMLLDSSAGPFSDALGKLFEAIKAEAENVTRTTGLTVAFGTGAVIGGVVVSAERQGLQLAAREQYANTARDSYVEVNEFDAALTVQEPGKRYYSVARFEAVRSRPLKICRLPEVGWCWEFNGRVLPTGAMAAALLHTLLDRIEQAPRRR